MGLRPKPPACAAGGAILPVFGRSGYHHAHSRCSAEFAVLTCHAAIFLEAPEHESCIVECVGQDGARRSGERTHAAGGRADLHRRDGARLARGRSDRHRGVGGDGLSGDDGRARQDAPSGGARRHSRAARARGRSRGDRERRDPADRSGGGESLPVRTGGDQSGHQLRRLDRADRHWRTEHGARGGQELPGRADSRGSGGLSARIGGARRRGRRGPGLPVRAGAQGIRAYRCLRRDDCAALAAVGVDGGQFTHAPLVLDGLAPDHLAVSARKLQDLRYGENPHQQAALYAVDPGWGFGTAQVVQGKGLSFTNLLDLDAAARLALEFTEPAAVVVKHTNPCGVATGASLEEAYVTARRGRSVVGVRRHRRLEPASRRRHGPRDCQHVHRGGGGAGRRRGCARGAGGQEEPAARAGRLRPADGRRRQPARGALDHGRAAGAGPRPGHGGGGRLVRRRGNCAGRHAARRDPAGAGRRSSGPRCGSPGACVRT